ncbi:DegT/DnrJ/EryC1/StrS family aminotransferase [Paenibacillus ehimensis]|uniref:Aminotransferase class I/II-fold pyridoxal phosphate-dependent enzyme n=1 Tax=Paenibacillus ehimensis TaxID=79264 RepID=A0ABT8VFZ1_9BACL|nr:aminotransferase class I/II-fold pyridoxal phosphate-dependent enzyme [Paenibacillus ehimensis]MDO3679902.1 aminotransferase class I/II-fold pyridoxal phosphate-dependent enzyme [Paenibacillus ehimensis]MEC0211004.1 aminotransferase class I/II-fold pyridoxal phosphate-dependent enzyme [Paenibacillus ehimensis]
MSLNQRIYLSPPHMGQEEQQWVQQAFATNWIAPLGPNVDVFEKEIAGYVGAGGALALSSGTAAIHLALRLLGVGAGDTVFCSSLTFVASVNPVVYQGAEPVFIDSEPESWNMSPQALERALSAAKRAGKLPKAVVVVNLYGQSADMDPLLDLCDQYGVPVIEDAAESLGATYKGRASGTLGRFGTYSFNGNKIITTSGGGMLVSDDLEALEKARYWATQARDPAPHYEHSEVGFNYRMSNVLAGIGIGQLRKLPERIETRRAIFAAYAEALGPMEGVAFMPEASFGQATRWLTALTVDPQVAKTTAGDIIRALAEANIESRPVWKPMHLQPLFQDCSYYPHQEGHSVSDRLFEQGICLPSGSSLTETEQAKVIEIVKTLVCGGMTHEIA